MTYVIGRCAICRENFIRMEPVFMEENDEWVKLDQTAAVANFPPKGLIFVLPFDKRFQLFNSHDYFYFQVRPNSDPKSSAIEERDQFVVMKDEQVVPLLQVFDYSGRDIEEIRQLLFEKGISKFTKGTRIFIKLNEDYEGIVVGLCRNEGTHDFFSEDYKDVYVEQVDKSDGVFQINGSDYVLDSKIKKLPCQKIFNWKKTADFVAEVVNMASKHFQTTEKTKNDVREIKDALVKYSKQNAYYEYSQVSDRTKSLMENVERSMDGAAMVAEVMMESPRGKELMQAGVQNYLKSRSDAIETEIAGLKKSQQAEKDRLQKIQTEIEAGLADKEKLEERLSELHGRLLVEADSYLDVVGSASLEERPAAAVFARRLERAMDGLRREFAAVMAGDDDRAPDGNKAAGNGKTVAQAPGKGNGGKAPAKTSAQAPASPKTAAGAVRAAAAVLAAATAPPPVEGYFPPSDVPPWSRKSLLRPKARAIRPEDLPARLAEERALGLSPEHLRLMDIFLRGGELALLLGRGAPAYVKRYAECVGSDNLFLFQPDGAASCLDDLWVSRATRQTTALASAWQGALDNPRRLFLLWVHSMDMCCWQLWLEPLVEALRSPRRPQNLLVCATLSVLGFDSNRDGTTSMVETAAGDDDNPAARSDLLPVLVVPLKLDGVGAVPESPREPAPTYVELPEPGTLAAGPPAGLRVHGPKLAPEEYWRRRKVDSISAKVLDQLGSWPRVDWWFDDSIHKSMRDGAAMLVPKHGEASRQA